MALLRKATFEEKLNQLHAELKGQIENGLLKPGECILSENQLSRKHKVSRPSVRKVLERLVQEQLLFKVPGKGTFVSEPKGSNARSASKSIGVVFYQSRSSLMGDPFSAAVFGGIEEEISARGHNLLFSSIRSVEGKITVPRMITEGAVDGAILFEVFDDRYIQDVVNTGIPVVLADHASDLVDLDSVVFDSAQGACDAVTHLLDLGHRDIAFIVGVRGGSDVGMSVDPSSWERLDGYKQALSSFDVPYRDDLIVKGHSSIEGGYATAQEILRSSSLPTAIFCCSYHCAIGAIKALGENGLKVPEDVSVVGFGDDDNLTAALTPALTTVKTDDQKMGQATVNVLCERFEDPNKKPVRLRIPTALIVRASSRERRKVGQK